MPNRIIREAILSSDKVDQLDPPAEVFYRRLLSKVDDHGRFDARLSILRPALFPLRVDRVREADCSRWIAACEKAGLIALYSHAGKPYLVVLNTGWPTRSASKYPDPPVQVHANICEQMQTSANKCSQLQTFADPNVVVVVDVVEDVVVPRTGGKDRKTALAEDWAVPADWIAEAATKAPGTDWGREAIRFASHHKSKGSAFKNWKQAWWTWVNSPYQKSAVLAVAPNVPGGGRKPL